MESDRITWEGGLGPMDQNNITDRNVEQLDFTGKHLGNLPRARSLPGSRSDGGMISPQKQTHDLIQQIVDNENRLRAELVDARATIDHCERDLATLQSEYSELKARHDLEKKQREHFEAMLRKIAELVVNGAKEHP